MRSGGATGDRVVRQALVLGGGLAWCAYQVGALRYLVAERALEFDLVAGTGMGALNAAMVACGRFEPLKRFWDDLTLRTLLRPNLRSPFREGPFRPGLQRELISEHVSERLLEERGTRLLVTAFNLQTGLTEPLLYPGASVPIVEAVLAAGATPGLLAPVLHRGRQLAEGSMIDSLPIGPVLDLEPEEIVVVAMSLGPDQDRSRRYRSWPAVAMRAMAMNQSHDVTAGLRLAQGRAAAAEAHRRVAAELPVRLAALAGDPETAARVREAVAGAFDRSGFPLRQRRGPLVRAVTPSRDLGYPLWRFRRGDLRAAAATGHRDARAVIVPEEHERERL